MIDTGALRNKILNLGICGELTQRLETDGNSEDLLKAIQTKKDELIKKKEIKKEKKLPDVDKEGYPFEIPHNWTWVRLGQIAIQITDGTHRTPNYLEEGVPFLSVKNISSGFLDFSDIKYISEEEHKELIKRCKPEKGDVLVCRIGTLGKALTIDTDIDFSIFVSLGLIKTISPILSDYVANVINSGYGYEWIRQNKAGGAMHTYKINLTDLYLLPVPLPPIDEQRRINERISELLAILDIIDECQNGYAGNLEALKKKIIDAGIQGEITSRLADDGDARDLYREIQEERTKQENDGLIKKVDQFTDVDDSEVPYEIPSNWMWTRFGNTSYIVRGGSPRPIKQYITTAEDGINWIKIGDVEKGGKYIYGTKEKIIPEGEKRSRKVYPGDFLLTNSMSFGRPYISKIEGCIHDGWLLIRNLGGFDPDYLYYLLSSSYLYEQFSQKASGSTVDNLNIDKVNTAIIPLPPIAEQRRIAGKIDELIAALPQ